VTLPRLNRDLIASDSVASKGVTLPDPAVFDLPETVVQFGTGAFLRGFVDFFLDEAIQQHVVAGRVVAIGSTGSGRDRSLEEQNGLYTIIVEGASANGPVRECRVVGSLSRALNAISEWEQVLAVARQPGLQFAFSNTTEVGIAVHDGDVLHASPPLSFPGKLARFLLERGRAFEFATDAGLVVIPCELIEGNGDKLRDLVLALARRWKAEPAFTEWIDRAIPFCNTLVDRIVPGRPDGERRAALENELGYRDDLMITAEPYRLFAIESNAAMRGLLAFATADDGIVLTDDVSPFRERKVRILNGAHSLLASIGLLLGCETVLEAMQHPLITPYVRQLLFGEIVPSLDVRGGGAFAREVLLRFANSRLRHVLRDITLQHTAKIRVRVLPSLCRFAKRRGSVPPALTFGFSAYLHLVRTALGKPALVGADAEGERVREAWRSVGDGSDIALRRVADTLCGDVALWHTDLRSIPSFVDHVTEHLTRMSTNGVAAALSAHLATHPDHSMTTSARSEA